MKFEFLFANLLTKSLPDKQFKIRLIVYDEYLTGHLRAVGNHMSAV